MKYSANWAYDVEYDVKISTFADERISRISDKTALAKIKAMIVGLSDAPDIKGKAHHGKLKGYRRLRFSRYRITYKVLLSRRLVVVADVGIEKEGDREDTYRELISFLDSTDKDWFLKPKYFRR